MITLSSMTLTAAMFCLNQCPWRTGCFYRAPHDPLPRHVWRRHREPDRFVFLMEEKKDG